MPTYIIPAYRDYFKKKEIRVSANSEAEAIELAEEEYKKIDWDSITEFHDQEDTELRIDDIEETLPEHTKAWIVSIDQSFYKCKQIRVTAATREEAIEKTQAVLDYIDWDSAPMPLHKEGNAHIRDDVAEDDYPDIKYDEIDSNGEYIEPLWD